MHDATTTPQYDALLVLSFGGPEGHDDVLPFLENVLRGRNVPQERMLQVAEHYYHFGGVSPINEQNRRLIHDLEQELAIQGPHLPIYWGNRNWHPLLGDTLKQMAKDGIRRALVYVTSAFGSYSGCRQYLENLVQATTELGSEAPQLEKLRTFHNHPLFIEAIVDRARAALAHFPVDELQETALVFTAHSIPTSMADKSPYVRQLEDACRLVNESLLLPRWNLVYQSRSGPPTQPWLEPDVCEHLRNLAQEKVKHVLLVPIGFLSDHMEVLYDLDTEARQVADELGLNMVRSETVGNHPSFISMIRELILERLSPHQPRRFLGTLGPAPDSCAVDCCPSVRR